MCRLPSVVTMLRMSLGDLAHVTMKASDPGTHDTHLTWTSRCASAHGQPEGARPAESLIPNYVRASEIPGQWELDGHLDGGINPLGILASWRGVSFS